MKNKHNTILFIDNSRIIKLQYVLTETKHGDTPNGTLACGHSTFDFALYVFPVPRDAAGVETSCRASGSLRERR